MYLNLNFEVGDLDVDVLAFVFVNIIRYTILFVVNVCKRVYNYLYIQSVFCKLRSCLIERKNLPSLKLRSLFIKQQSSFSTCFKILPTLKLRSLFNKQKPHLLMSGLVQRVIKGAVN